MPAEEGGDAGIDALVIDDEAIYQCYAPREPLPGKERFEKQREKIRADLKKLVDDPSGRVKKFIGSGQVKRWVLLTPFLRRSDLVAVAREEEDRVRRAGLPYIAEDFRVIIGTAEMFPVERARLAAGGRQPEIRFDNPWGNTVWSWRLWPKDAIPSEEALRYRCAHLASLCWHSLAEQPPEQGNPWRDLDCPADRATSRGDRHDYPSRVLGLFELLTEQCLKTQLLEEEAAAVALAPFLREAALAAGEAKLLAVADPFDTTPPGATRHWLRHTLEAYRAKRPQLQRKVERLREAQEHEATRAVGWWLLHKTAAGLAEIWEPEDSAGTGLFPVALQPALKAVASLMPSGQHGLLLDPLRLARFLATDPEAYDDSSFDAKREIPFTKIGRSGELRLRASLLVRLLALVGQMGNDPRRLAEVVVDHIGLGDPTDPNSAKVHCRWARWDVSEKDAVLHAECEHPAYDLAFELLVDQLYRERNAMRMANEANPRGLEPLSHLPAFSHSVTPQSERGDRPTYVKPHVRFELATDEIKELLMGEQLYGDPMLAVRELYQNALDACRYREARLKALAASTALKDPKSDARRRYEELVAGYLADWKAARPRAGFQPSSTTSLIRMAQYTREGRLVIECADDGVGMSRGHLEQCFARAGRRFSDTDEFVMERARWRDLEGRLGLDDLDLDDQLRIEFTPNSQFGIGVFSYLMLAEEIEVITRRFHVDPRNSETLVARISGSGSLFRIRASEEQRRTCGTSVRLYLPRATYLRKRDKWSQKREAAPILLRETMLKLLRVGEYHMEVTDTTDANDQTIDWKEGEFRPSPAEKADYINILPGQAWWRLPLENSFAPLASMLADGILTEDKRNDGLCLNFQKSRRPVLSVDRQHFQQVEVGWIERKVLPCAAERLRHTPNMRYEWLAQVALHHWAVAQTVYEQRSVNPESRVIAFVDGCINFTRGGLWPPDIKFISLLNDFRRLKPRAVDEESDELEKELISALGPPRIAQARVNFLAQAELVNLGELRRLTQWPPDGNSDTVTPGIPLCQCK